MNISDLSRSIILFFYNKLYKMHFIHGIKTILQLT